MVPIFILRGAGELRRFHSVGATTLVGRFERTEEKKIQGDQSHRDDAKNKSRVHASTYLEAERVLWGKR